MIGGSVGNGSTINSSSTSGKTSETTMVLELRDAGVLVGNGGPTDNSSKDNLVNNRNQIAPN